MEHVKTAKEALDIFLAGQPIHVVELGGLGPGYEQAIWDGIFKLIQEFHEEPESFWIKEVDGKKEWTDGLDDKFYPILEGEGLSGAQYGAIKSTAFQVMHYGWEYMMDQAPEDRLIMVNNTDSPKLEPK